MEAVEESKKKVMCVYARTYVHMYKHMHALEREQFVTHVRVLCQIKEKMIKLQNTPSDPKAVELTKTVQIAKSDGAVAEMPLMSQQDPSTPLEKENSMAPETWNLCTCVLACARGRFPQISRKFFICGN
jgi:hypothetical protein